MQINRNLDMNSKYDVSKSRVRRKKKNKTKKAEKNEYDMKYNPNSVVCRPLH